MYTMSYSFMIKESISGFRRAKLAAFGSSFTIAVSLLLIGLFYVFSTNTSRLVESVKQKVELEVFLQEPVSRQRINEIQHQITSLEGIEKVQFVSKDDAAKIFKEEFGEDINNVLDFNPLPPSFKIFLKEGYRTADKAAQIHKMIVDINGVENIAYRKELLEFLDQRARILYDVGLVVGIIFGISAVFLVANTIRLTIYAKRKSIQTMKLIGASRWFVRAPFLIEGVLQGVTGGCIAAGIIYYLLTFAAGLISSEIAQFVQVDKLFYLYVIISGIALGFFGSAVSVRKFIGESVSS